MPDRQLTTTAPDGRTLGFAEWGDPDGVPVVALHGTPGCRLNRHPDEDAVRARGVRLVTCDRAGYGLSSPHPGRRVVDVVGDVVAVLDRLGIDRFAVTGGSGGGPHSLAVAALLPERVVRAGCIVGVAPYDALGDAWTTGMDPENVREFGWALAGEDVLRPELVREAAGMRERVSGDPTAVLGDFVLPAADRAVLARPEIQRVITEATAEMFRGGVEGWLEDDLAFTRPWGFDPMAVQAPTAVWWGAHDVLTPPSHGEWLARAVPGAVTRVDTSGGHQADPEVTLALFSWLAHGTPWPE